MSGLEIAGALLAAGVGGAVGAAAAVLLSGTNATAAYDEFAADFRQYMAGKSDPASQVLVDSFDAFSRALGGLMTSIGKLKRALRIK